MNKINKLLRLSDVIALWDVVHKKDIGTFDFTDFTEALETKFIMVNDCSKNLPSLGAK